MPAAGAAADVIRAAFGRYAAGDVPSMSNWSRKT
jgi:hypothetical protein